MFFGTFEFDGFFKDNISGIVIYTKRARSLRYAKSQPYSKGKNVKKNIAVCLGVLSRGFLFFYSFFVCLFVCLLGFFFLFLFLFFCCCCCCFSL